MKASGLQLPSTAFKNKPGTPKILTEKQLDGWRKAQLKKDDVRFSRKLTEGFYSALQEAVENAPMKMGDAQAWKQYLTGQINKGAVKEDEVFWSGVREWLDAQQGKVSRQGVQDWLAGSHLRIEPVQLDAQYVVQGTDEKEHVFDSREEAQQFYDAEMDWAASASEVSEDEDEISIYDNDERVETITRETKEVWLDEYGDEFDLWDLKRRLRIHEYIQEDGDTLTIYDGDGDERAKFTRGEIESWESDRGGVFDSRNEALEYAQDQASENNAEWESRVRFDANEHKGTKYHDYSFAGKGGRLPRVAADGASARKQSGVAESSRTGVSH